MFDVSGHRYAIPSTDCVEIVRAVSFVPLPKAPAIIEGAMNYRGHLVPVLDIRTRFRLAAKAISPSDHLIIARAGDRHVGIRVDRVVDITRIDEHEIEPVAAITPRSEYVAGIAKLPAGLVLIHDLQTFLTAAETEGTEAAIADALA